MNYIQCQLKKQNMTTTAWIPEGHAVIDHMVKIKQEDGSWEDGWKVINCGTVSMDESQAIVRSRDYKKQRKASDI